MLSRNQMSFHSLFLMLIFLAGCAGNPISRRSTGVTYRKKNNDPYAGYKRNRLGEFQPIKKKIALLKFFNESPFEKKTSLSPLLKKSEKKLPRPKNLLSLQRLRIFLEVLRRFTQGAGSSLHNLLERPSFQELT
jgi:hypothetical protein